MNLLDGSRVQVSFIEQTGPRADPLPESITGAGPEDFDNVVESLRAKPSAREPDHIKFRGKDAIPARGADPILRDEAAAPIPHAALPLLPPLAATGDETAAAATGNNKDSAAKDTPAPRAPGSLHADEETSLTTILAGNQQGPLAPDTSGIETGPKSPDEGPTDLSSKRVYDESGEAAPNEQPAVNRSAQPAPSRHADPSPAPQSPGRSAEDGVEAAAAREAVSPDARTASILEPAAIAPLAREFAATAEISPRQDALLQADGSIAEISAPAQTLSSEPPRPGAIGAADLSLKAAAIRPPPFEVASIAKRNDGGIDLRLDPPDLGPVSIQFFEDSAGAQHATISTERGETLDLLRRHSEWLQRELSRQGAGDFILNFTDRRESAPSGRDARDRRGLRFGESPDRMIQSIVRTPPASISDRIDLIA